MSAVEKHCWHGAHYAEGPDLRVCINCGEKFPNVETAQGYIHDRMDTMQQCIEHRDKPDMKDPEYVRALYGSVDGFQCIALMEVLRMVAPEVADRLATDINEALEDGGVLGELLWEWQESRKTGAAVSVSINAHPGYRNLFQRIVSPEPGEVSSMTASDPWHDPALALAAAQPWMQTCGPCDMGLPMGCCCPTGDPRAIVSRLVAVIERLTPPSVA